MYHRAGSRYRRPREEGQDATIKKNPTAATFGYAPTKETLPFQITLQLDNKFPSLLHTKEINIVLCGKKKLSSRFAKENPTFDGQKLPLHVGYLNDRNLRTRK